MDALHRQLTERAPFGIGVYDAGGVVLHMNRQACAYMGLKLEQIVGKSLFDLFPPEAARVYQDRLDRALAGEDGLHFEDPVELCGQTRWFASRYSRMVDEAGLPAGVLIYSMEVTELKEVEQRLRESESLFRSMFEEHEAVMLLIDPEAGWIVDANRAAARFYGYDRDELRHMCIDDINRMDPQDVAQARRRARDGESNTFIFDHRLRSGEVRTVEVHSSPVEYQGRILLFSIIHDLTALREARADAAQAREKFRTYAEHAPLGVFVADAQGRYIDVNPAACAMLGYTRAELLQLSVFDVGERPADQDGDYSFDSLKDNGASQLEIPLRRKDGSLVHVDLRAVALGGGAFMAFCADISARKQAEREQELMQAQLRQSQKLEVVGQLAGGVAHDFNNLLMIINSYAGFVADALRDDDPLMADLQQVREAGRRAAGLTRQLLAFSRKQVLQPETLDLNHVIRAMSEMLERLIGEDVLLEMRLADDLGRVFADTGQIEQVIMNLAVNARDAMPDGGTLVIETSNVDGPVALVDGGGEDAGGPWVRLAVGDDGQGMDEKTQERIFEPFFTTKGQGRGTGLGLSTVYGIVKQSGGDIQVESKPGRGTRFEILLPRTAAEARPAADEEVAIPLEGRETVLVVEDEDGVRDLVRRILAGAGYDVLTAANAGEALLICEQRGDDIKLLLTDVVMPLMSGKQLADRLGQIAPHLRVLYMSGYPGDSLARGETPGPGVHILQKPFQGKELLSRVRRTLDGKG